MERNKSSHRRTPEGPRIMNYISEECKQCEEYRSPYGCTNDRCSIYKDWEEDKADYENIREEKLLREKKYG